MSVRGSKDLEKKAPFTFIWIIENFSLNFVCVRSPTFTVKSMGETKWYLQLLQPSVIEKLQLEINREEGDALESIVLECEVSILTSDGLPSEVRTKHFPFRKNDRFFFELGPDKDELFDQKRAEFLPYNKFTIRCRMWRACTEILTSQTCLSHFRLGIYQYSGIWNLVDFTKLQLGEIRQRCLNSTSNTLPELILSFFLTERCGKYYANLQIDQNHGTENFYMSFKLSLLDISSRSVQSDEIHSVIFANRRKVYTFQDFLERGKICKSSGSLLFRDVLRLKCELVIDSKPFWDGHSNCLYLDSESLTTEMLKMYMGVSYEYCTADCSFKKTLEVMYGDESLSDVTLRAGGLSLAAHKSVLGARSPVFKVMFTHDMREKTSKSVDIFDFDADTVDRLLLYIYKNTVENLEWEDAMDLFRAADKYQLLDLKKRCSAILTSNISVSNVCTILSLSDMHADGELLKAAEDFVSRHDSEVFDSNEWNTLKEKNYRLAFEVMERIIRLGKRKNY